ncbi:ankyrin repeat-containing domain protein [Achaetomium macrosporum]|uniref:Ankyrin repeat-containing domain protein n=1 Tax=Achaetomium macrosporum TaxID=79813 RepID=A0AAN7C183_9PEZI|nr:ankyrin repeat-containing domain protein [Achaetomium macrosporum]
MDFNLHVPNTDPTERRRLQNRLAQRKFRLKKAADRRHPDVAPHPMPQDATQAHNPVAPPANHFIVVSSPQDPTSQAVANAGETDFGEFDAVEGFLSDLGVPMLPPEMSAPILQPAFDFGLPEALLSSNDQQHSEQPAVLPPPQDQVLYEFQADNSLRILSTAAPEAALDGWLGTLHIAAQRGNEEIVRILLQQGKVDCNERDSDGRTALMYAVIEGHETMVRVLLAHGARVDDVDRDRRSALHLAVLHRRESVLRVLLDHRGPGLDLDAYDVSGWTPLHMAVERDFAVAVELLLQNGANLHTKARKCPLMGRAVGYQAE